MVGGARANDGSAGVMRGIGVGFGDEGFPGNGHEFTKVASEGVFVRFLLSFSFSRFPLVWASRNGWRGGGGAGKLGFRSGA